VLAEHLVHEQVAEREAQDPDVGRQMRAVLALPVP
jgi:hypothetical protein